MTHIRNRLRAQRGEGKVGLIIAIILVVFIIHLAMKFIPYKIEIAELEGTVEDSLQKLANNLIAEDEFYESVGAKADELDLPFTEEAIDLELVGNSTWKVDIKYDRILKMVWGDWSLPVHIEMARQKF